MCYQCVGGVVFQYHMEKQHKVLLPSDKIKPGPRPQCDDPARSDAIIAAESMAALSCVSWLEPGPVGAGAHSSVYFF